MWSFSRWVVVWIKVWECVQDYFFFFACGNNPCWVYLTCLWNQVDGTCTLKIGRNRSKRDQFLSCVDEVKRNLIRHSSFGFTFFDLSYFAKSWPRFMTHITAYCTLTTLFGSFGAFSALMWPCAMPASSRVSADFLNMIIFLAVETLGDCVYSGKTLAFLDLKVFNKILHNELTCHHCYGHFNMQRGVSLFFPDCSGRPD